MYCSQHGCRPHTDCVLTVPASALATAAGGRWSGDTETQAERDMIRLNLVKMAKFQKWFFGVFPLEITSLG